MQAGSTRSADSEGEPLRLVRGRIERREQSPLPQYGPEEAEDANLAPPGGFACEALQRCSAVCMSRVVTTPPLRQRVCPDLI
jgi:hypothetical protein